MNKCRYEKEGHCLLNECLYGDFLERDDSRYDSGRYCWKPNDVEVNSESEVADEQ